MENELVISEDKENEYDPFNPTDSDIEIESKEKIDENKKVEELVISQPPAVEVVNSVNEVNEEEDEKKKKSDEIKSQPESSKNIIKKHRSNSRSRTTSKRSSKHRSKSKSRDRKKDSNRHHYHHRSSYNNNKRSPSPYERNRSKSKRSRSRSQSHKHKKRSTKSRSRSITKYNNNSKTNSSSNNNNSNKKRSRTKSPPSKKTISVNNKISSKEVEETKRSNLIQIQTQNEALKSSNNNKQSKSIADYLIEEMINDEKQVKVDVNNIKLPDYVNKTNTNNITKLEQDNSPPPLNNISPELAKLQAKLLLYNSKNNDIKTNDVIKQPQQSSFSINNSSFASSSSFASVSGIENNKNNKTEEDEPYDVEAEYKELDERLNEFNKKNVLNNNSSLNDTIPSTTVSKINKKKVQDEIVNAAKQAIKPFYVNKKINKDDYKMIMKKVVNKCLQHAKDNTKVDTTKVSKMIIGYVNKVRNEASKQKKN